MRRMKIKVDQGQLTCLPNFDINWLISRRESPLLPQSSRLRSKIICRRHLVITEGIFGQLCIPRNVLQLNSLFFDITARILFISSTIFVIDQTSAIFAILRSQEPPLKPPACLLRGCKTQRWQHTQPPPHTSPLHVSFYIADLSNFMKFSKYIFQLHLNKFSKISTL